MFKNSSEIEYPEDYPNQDLETNEKLITKGEIEEFEELIIAKSAEKQIDDFLCGHKNLFSAILDVYHTGHHGSWVIPKQMIKPKTQESRGLIPDYLISGKSSDGFEWWVVELKGADQNIFTVNKNSEIYFANELNKGICQLLEYIDFCIENQSMLRDTFNLQYFREPNGILLVGTEDELLDNENKMNLKGAWNRLVKPKLEIRTYSWFLRNLKSLYRNYN